jgi:hypothetical protein
LATFEIFSSQSISMYNQVSGYKYFYVMHKSLISDIKESQVNSPTINYNNLVFFIGNLIGLYYDDDVTNGEFVWNDYLFFRDTNKFNSYLEREFDIIDLCERVQTEFLVNILLEQDLNTSHIEVELRFKLAANIFTMFNAPENSYTIQLYTPSKIEKTQTYRVYNNQSISIKLSPKKPIKFFDKYLSLSTSAEIVNDISFDVLNTSLLITERRITRKSIQYQGFRIDISYIGEIGCSSNTCEAEIEFNGLINYIELIYATRFLLGFTKYNYKHKIIRSQLEPYPGILTFILPEPLTYDHYIHLTPNDFITLKYDGQRILLIAYDNTIYTFNRKNEFTVIDTISKKLPLSVYDAEIMDNGNIYIFDCLIADTEDIRSKSYSERYSKCSNFPRTKQYYVKSSYPCTEVNFRHILSEFDNNSSTTDGFIIYPPYKNYMNSPLKWKNLHTIDLKYSNKCFQYYNPKLQSHVNLNSLLPSLKSPLGDINDIKDDSIVECYIEPETDTLVVYKIRYDKKYANSELTVSSILKIYKSNILSRDNLSFKVCDILFKIHNNVKNLIFNDNYTLDDTSRYNTNVRGYILDVGTGKGSDVMKMLPSYRRINKIYCVEPNTDSTKILLSRIKILSCNS